MAMATHDQPTSTSEQAVLPTMDKHSIQEAPEQDEIKTKEDAAASLEANTGSAAPDDKERPDEAAQAGVKAAEAVTLTWSRKWLIVAYLSMWAVYMTNAFQSSITANLSAYIVSGFEEHSLIPVITTVSSVMSAATAMPVAKMLNTWDRGHGFIFMAAIATLGLVLSAACTNIYTYCAAQVFYSVGFVGMIFAVDVITLDTSSLTDRGLAYAFTSSPYIITAFAGPKASENFYDSNWRWGYGCFAIVLPIACLPLYGTLWYNKRKARQSGLLSTRSGADKRSLVTRAWDDFVIEFDLVGVVLLAGGLALFLLPFNIAVSAADQWASPHIIAMLVVGFVLLAFFCVWERLIAPKPFIPFHLLFSRTILGTCLLSMMYQIAYYCWDSYFTSYLQVVYHTSIAGAGYISSIFDMVSGVWLLCIGFAIRRTARFRWLLYFSVPLYLLGEGLLIYFRGEGHGVGFIVMCQIFMALGGGAIIIVNQVAVLAASSHNDGASALAVLALASNIGDAIGNSVSGAIWTHLFPSYLIKYLPAESADAWEDIYDSLDVQLSYPVGDPTRSAIAHAYADTQTRMVAAGTAFMAVGLVLMFVIKNIRLDSIAQVKGVLF